MRDFGAIDLSLFGLPAEAPVYDGLSDGRRWSEPDDAETAVSMFLDIKAEAPADPLDEMQEMLAAMTKELRERFQRFQSQRQAAEDEAEAAEDEAGRKLAQVDAKAAIEAISLIVRTLEKIDSLYRTIMHDRREAAERAGEGADYEALAADFERLVEERAEERANAKFKEMQQACGAGGDVAGSAGKAAAAGDGENGP
ncbi:MAG: hypothetical protein QHC90_24025 [Shinella sp.]|nr:hypothetical protein [Shinella sp.]